MEGQGQRDRYGRPLRQSSQSYPQGFNVAGQSLPSSYTSQREAQAQLGGQTQSYGSGQASGQRPGSGGYPYGQPSISYSGHQIPQYGGDFGTDPARQQYSPMISYYPSQGVYDPSYRQQPIQSQQSQIPSQPFPEYYPDPSTSYSAPPGTPSQLQQHYPYAQRSGRSSNPSPYTPISTAYPGFDSGQMQPPPVQSQQQQADLPRPNEGFRLYLRRLRETYEHIQAGRLAQGGQALLDASEALLTRVEEFGLTKDDENLHDQRLKMWKEFNLCWLAFMQRLKDALEELVQTGQQPLRPQSIITSAFLERMGDKLIAWTDSIEKWGLADYETGVWEEEILEVAGDCRSIFEANSELFATTPQQAT